MSLFWIIINSIKWECALVVQRTEWSFASILSFIQQHLLVGKSMRRNDVQTESFTSTRTNFELAR